ncbi:MAG: Outer rane lipoprotein omp16 precursor [Myxococcaceae bacterium]|nr:Outer rane lipoprotein omp16 precursor [Myxococcaceae bacterium]
MKTRSLLAVPFFLAATFPLFTSQEAHAQPRTSDATGFLLNRYDPAERGSDWFANESLDFRGKSRLALGLTADWARKPLVLYRPNGDEYANLVSDQVYLHAGGTLVLADRFRVGLNLPILVYQHGAQLVGFQTNTQGPNKEAIGDLRLTGDVRVFGEYGDAITGAVGLAVYFPTGSREQFTGDGTMRVQPRAMVSGDIGLFTYAARLGYHIRPYTERFAGSDLGSEFLFGGAAGVKIADKLVVGPELYGSTVVNGDGGAFATRNTQLEGLLSAKATIANDFKIGGAFGPGLQRGYGTPEFRLLGSVEWAPCSDKDGDGVCDGNDACPTIQGVKSDNPKLNGCPADRDGDGILDSMDACPDDPGPRTNDPRTNGCPDRDHDGVADKEDACPDVPGVRTNDPKTNGCPPDRDHDGVIDAEDACPDVPGVRTNDPKTNGCPPDRDGDGVYDNEDACPDVPGVRTNDPKTNGCPPDRDGDKILDKDDACPDVPGDPDPDPKKHGCPKAIIEGKQIKITEQIKFRFDKAEIDPASDPILQAVAKILMDHPEMTKLKVEGHTDNVGQAAYNLKLSKQRAEAVKKWLVAHGVPAERLLNDGYGMTRPIDKNDTEEGRRNNRRVEFHILDDAAGTDTKVNPTSTTVKPVPATPPGVRGGGAGGAAGGTTPAVKPAPTTTTTPAPKPAPAPTTSAAPKK